MKYCYLTVFAHSPVLAFLSSFFSKNLRQNPKFRKSEIKSLHINTQHLFAFALKEKCFG